MIGSTNAVGGGGGYTPAPPEPGKNLFNIDGITGAVNYSGDALSGTSVITEDGMTVLQSTQVLYNTAVVWVPFLVHLAAGTYTVSADIKLAENSAGKQVGIGFRTSDYKNLKTNYGSLTAFDSYERISTTLTVAAETDVYLCLSAVGMAGATEVLAQFRRIQIEAGDTATEYEPYQG